MAKDEIHVTFKGKERSETWLGVEKDTEVTSDPHQSATPYTACALHQDLHVTFTCPRNWSWY